MKIVIALQARTGSSRVPAKILKPIHKFNSMFEALFNQLKQVKGQVEYVLTTSDSPDEERLITLAKSQGFKVSTAPVDDIVTRLYKTAELVDADVLVRIWGDCPFVCPDLIEEMLSIFEEKKYQFMSNSEFYTRTIPAGMDVEIYSRKLIQNMSKDVVDVKQREFPVEYIKKNLAADDFGFWNMKEDYSRVHLTIDYPEDFIAGEKALKVLLKDKSYFRKDDVIHLINEFPGIIAEFSGKARNKELKEFLDKGK